MDESKEFDAREHVRKGWEKILRDSGHEKGCPCPLCPKEVSR